MDPSWSETGDRYLLKLFRDYLFHQVAESGAPWVDLAHIVACLNKVSCKLITFLRTFRAWVLLLRLGDELWFVVRIGLRSPAMFDFAQTFLANYKIKDSASFFSFFGGCCQSDFFCRWSYFYPFSVELCLPYQTEFTKAFVFLRLHS